MAPPVAIADCNSNSSASRCSFTMSRAFSVPSYIPIASCNGIFDSRIIQVSFLGQEVNGHRWLRGSVLDCLAILGQPRRSIIRRTYPLYPQGILFSRTSSRRQLPLVKSVTPNRFLLRNTVTACGILGRIGVPIYYAMHNRIAVVALHTGPRPRRLKQPISQPPGHRRRCHIEQVRYPIWMVRQRVVSSTSQVRTEKRVNTCSTTAANRIKIP
jgi:hypothetical protein